MILYEKHEQNKFQQITIHGIGKYEWSDGRVSYRKYCSLILEVGLKVKCTVEENIYGKMGNVMMGNIILCKKQQNLLQHDKKCGFGIFYWPDGKQFQGQWQNGRQHGKGLMIGKDGKKRMGTWQEGKLVSSTEDDNFQFIPEGWIQQQQ